MEVAPSGDQDLPVLSDRVVRQTEVARPVISFTPIYSLSPAPPLRPRRSADLRTHGRQGGQRTQREQRMAPGMFNRRMPRAGWHAAALYMCAAAGVLSRGAGLGQSHCAKGGSRRRRQREQNARSGHLRRRGRQGVGLQAGMLAGCPIRLTSAPAVRQQQPGPGQWGGGRSRLGLGAPGSCGGRGGAEGGEGLVGDSGSRKCGGQTSAEERRPTVTPLITRLQRGLRREREREIRPSR